MAKRFHILLALLISLLTACTQQMPSNTGEGQALQTLLKDSQKVAIIKFHAKWCASCKTYAPTFAKVKSQLQDQADFFEIDVDDAKNKALVKELKVARIPETVFVSIDRKNVFKKLGPLSETDLSNTINEQTQQTTSSH